MRISVDKDELYPFYTLETNQQSLGWGYVVEVSNEEGELLKIMWQEAMDKLSDVQEKLKGHYIQAMKEGKNKYEFPDSSSINL